MLDFSNSNGTFEYQNSHTFNALLALLLVVLGNLPQQIV